MRHFKFIGDPRDDHRGPPAIRLFGYDFPMGQSVEVVHPDAIAKLAGNDHFEDVTPDLDTSAPVAGSSPSIENLDEDEKGVSNTHTLGGDQELVTTPESAAPVLPSDLTDRQYRAMEALCTWFASSDAEHMPLATFNAVMLDAGVIAPDASRAQFTNLRSQLAKRGMIGQVGGKAGRVWLTTLLPAGDPPV